MTQEVLKLALEALELEEAQTHYPSQSTLKAITAIKEALAQEQEQERMTVVAIKLEREACALICDAVIQDISLGPLEKYRASWIANSIRARGAEHE